MTRPSLHGPPLRLSGSAPLPIFENPSGSSRRDANGWTFRFLGRERRCGPTVDWSLERANDQLWSMNLHYFEHAQSLGDDDWLDLVLHWIAANPPFAANAAHAAWNAYALSIRVTSWMQQLAVRRAAVGRAETPIVDSIARQLRYLERHLETDIGGNHLFKNITALLWASAALEGVEAGRWRTTGLRLLDRALGQFLPDGVHFERSPSYHCQVLGDLLSIRHALSSDPFGGRLDDTIGRALQAAVDLAHPDRLAAIFGDAGLHMAPPPQALAGAAARVGVTSARPRSYFAYPDAGYFGAREGGDFVVIDAGPLGPDPLPGHAHGDMFAFEWSVGGRRVIVDQGVFEYKAGARRQASRTASSHNTVAAPGADQGEFFGAFRLGRRTRVRTRTADASHSGLLVDGEHSGFVGSSARHRRLIDAQPARIAVDDWLSADLPGAASSLLLAPEAAPRPDGENRIVLGGFDRPIVIEGSAPISIEPAVWWPDMGVEVATTRLRMSLGGRHGWLKLSAEGQE